MTIQVTCNGCSAKLRLEPCGVRLTVYDNDRSFYEFFCLTCKRLSIKPANHYHRSLLVAAQVACRYIHVPAEAGEIEKMTGPAITDDNLLDFVKDLRAIADPVLKAQLTSSTRNDSDVRRPA